MIMIGPTFITLHAQITDAALLAQCNIMFSGIMDHVIHVPGEYVVNSVCHSMHLH